ncbi:MAG: glutamate racemase [Christensenellales bacterium]
MKEAPIGFFDSGLGGISVLKKALEVLPTENYIYYGDNANAPYGSKTNEEIFRLAMDGAAFLVDKGVKAFVVACNTATSVAINEIRRIYELPVISMEPAVKPALACLQGGKALVMATPSTLSQDRYRRLLTRLDCEKDVVNLPCKELAGMIEKGDFSSGLDEYLKELLSSVQAAVDVIVLGCTHYIFIADRIQKTAKEIFGRQTACIDGNLGTVNQLKKTLENQNIQNTRGGSVKLYASGDAALFHRFLYG